VVMMPPCPFDSGVERTADGVETMLVSTHGVSRAYGWYDWKSLLCRAEALLATDGEGARDDGRARHSGEYSNNCHQKSRAYLLCRAAYTAYIVQDRCVGCQPPSSSWPFATGSLLTLLPTPTTSPHPCRQPLWG
jgi:hypothetical protein